MGFFSKKEKTPKEKEIKKILGGAKWTPEVKDLFDKYKVGIFNQSEALNQVKQEALTHKIQSENYLNRLDTLLKNKRKEKLEEENKIFEKEIREGIKCAVIKMVDSEKEKHSELVRGISTLGWGITGYALTSGKKTGAHETYIQSILKIVPNGIVISAENENDMRLPWNKIINSEYNVTIKGTRINIKLMEGEYLNLITSSKYYKEITYLINESAAGVEEEGWE
ncbi:MAG: hypothetical protein LBM26_01620 [Methanobrevibacter sp.]|jgi:hypothetical protein|nr:hypothetical protein [Methanobrevibacter sp.]